MTGLASTYADRLPIDVRSGTRRYPGGSVEPAVVEVEGRYPSRTEVPFGRTAHRRPTPAPRQRPTRADHPLALTSTAHEPAFGAGWGTPVTTVSGASNSTGRVKQSPSLRAPIDPLRALIDPASTPLVLGEPVHTRKSRSPAWFHVRQAKNNKFRGPLRHEHR